MNKLPKATNEYFVKALNSEKGHIYTQETTNAFVTPWLRDSTISIVFRENILTHWMVVEPRNKGKISKYVFVSYLLLSSFIYFFYGLLIQKCYTNKTKEPRMESDGKRQHSLATKSCYVVMIVPRDIVGNKGD